MDALRKQSRRTLLRMWATRRRSPSMGMRSPTLREALRGTMYSGFDKAIKSGFAAALGGTYTLSEYEIIDGVWRPAREAD